MTLITERPPAAPPPPEEPPEEDLPEVKGILHWLTSTDHKQIGLNYMVTAFLFFLIGGLMAMFIRAELVEPGQQIVSNDLYNELFTMHGTIMLLAFMGPFAIGGLANFLVPIMIGARDMAFPRLNLTSYWLYLGGAVLWLVGFATADGAADFGWFAYTPLSDGVRSPGVGGDLWIAGVVLTGLASIMSAVNILTTVYTMRAPGMSMFRMPIFVWNMVAVSILILLVFPVVTAAGAMLYADRVFDAHIFDINNGGEPILWQHLFWFFGHPEVYILILPYFGVVTEIFPVFSRRPVFGYVGLVIATMAIAALSVGVWAHHMYATGAITLPFFGITTMLIAVPTGVKFFNWIGTMIGGAISFATPMLFSLGFLVVFVVGGVTGVILASAPLDFHLTDSYFVVAHFHYVLFGGGIFALFGGIYYWFPKFTGRILDERLGHIHFWLTFIGFNATFFVQHIAGLEGMPRRIPDYQDTFHVLNLISSIGAFVLGAATLPFLYNVFSTLRKPKDPRADDPWGGHTLEWWTTSPPAKENFDRPLPPIRSERPVWDHRHPDHIAFSEHAS